MYISEALQLLQTIKTLQTLPIARQIRFGYLLAHNRRVLETAEETYQAALKTPEDEADNTLLAKFEQERIAALEEIAVKDSTGQPLIENNAYVIDNLAKKLPPIEAKLRAAYPTIGQIIQERTKRIEVLGREEQEFALRRLPMAQWPALPETLSDDAINSIFLFLVEDDT
jgi:hypothetical protein